MSGHGGAVPSYLHGIDLSRSLAGIDCSVPTAVLEHTLGAARFFLGTERFQMYLKTEGAVFVDNLAETGIVVGGAFHPPYVFLKRSLREKLV